ncbi:hypothetical protein HY501_01345 [Candidatus Woesearchaeota archaeon]|nr:hypothetical protein [Candidatus Woesearchaeota archaeon]
MGFFSKKDPICGMKEEKGKGLMRNGKWFCSSACSEEYQSKSQQAKKHSGCC